MEKDVDKVKKQTKKEGADPSTDIPSISILAAQKEEAFSILADSAARRPALSIKSAPA